MKRSFASAWKAVKSEMFPHVLATFQLMALIFVVIPFANSPIIIAGGVDNALKVIMPFHFWLLGFSAILFGLFYRIRRGEIERFVTVISFLATMFAVFNLALHFINNYLLLMWVTESLAVILYLIIPLVGLFRISNVFLLPLIRRLRTSKQH